MKTRNATVTLTIETDEKYPRLKRAEFWQRIINAAVRGEPSLLTGDAIVVRGARVDVVQPIRLPNGMRPGARLRSKLMPDGSIKERWIGADGNPTFRKPRANHRAKLGLRPRTAGGKL